MVDFPARTINWIPQTKLQPPHLGQALIPRPELFQTLHQAVTCHRLTLISAPAGYGKTTLLASLAHTTADLPLAWLTLDEADNDPVGFLNALIAALQVLNPACGVTARALLESLDNPGAEIRRVTGVLINKILETLPVPFILVLDDLHTITEPGVYNEIEYLLGRMPPQMHVAIGTRYEPPLALARLRSLGELAELRLDDLKFTLNEATALLNDRLRLGLSAADLILLHDRAEGWPAALRLFAGSLQHLPPLAARAAFITQLTQSNRYIFDLLAEEILNRQEPAIQAFLLETSILAELTPAVCQAVTGRHDADIILAELYRRNLLLVAIADDRQPVGEGVWLAESPFVAPDSPSYRFHDLLANFFRQQLSRYPLEQVRELHRRAAQAQNVPARAIKHYLLANLWEEAAVMITQIGEPLLQQGLLVTLKDWILALPAAVREAYPWLSYLLGVCAWQQRELATATGYLEQALAGFESGNEQVGQGKTLAYLANLAFFQANFPGGLALIERALTFPMPTNARVRLLIERARVVQFQGNFAQVDADVASALQIYRASDDEASLRTLLEGFIQGFMARPGGLDRLEQLCREAEARMAADGELLRVVLDEQWAVVHLYRGNIGLSLDFAERALELGERLGGRPAWQYWSTQVGRLISYTIIRDRVRANQQIDQLWPQFEKLDAFPMRGFFYHLAHACWLQSRFSDVHRLYHLLQRGAGTASNPVTALLLTLLQGLLETDAGHHPAAAKAFQEAVKIEAGLPFFNFFGSARVLLAATYLKMGLPEEALAEIAQALQECEAQGAPGRILIEAGPAIPVLQLAVEHKRHPTLGRQLLDTLEAGQPDGPRPVVVPDTGNTLSSREVEVLRLIAAGASNQEIAQTLVLSIHTVKRHVANILGKLNAASRTQAAARARELQIV